MQERWRCCDYRTRLEFHRGHVHLDIAIDLWNYHITLYRCADPSSQQSQHRDSFLAFPLSWRGLLALRDLSFLAWRFSYSRRQHYWQDHLRGLKHPPRTRCHSHHHHQPRKSAQVQHILYCKSRCCKLFVFLRWVPSWLSDITSLRIL